MPRRPIVSKKQILPDAKYSNVIVSIFISKLMKCGKKSTAERAVYGALQRLEKQESKDPITVMEQAVKNAQPLLEVKPRRVGGATYQVPVEVDPERSQSLALRWLLQSAKARGGKSLAEKLASELTDASKGQGTTIKKRDDTHKMAESNKAFAHFRW